MMMMVLNFLDLTVCYLYMSIYVLTKPQATSTSK